MRVTTPSGFSGEIRKLKGHESNLLSDRRSARRGETTDGILSGVWLETHDVGPYGQIVEVGTGPVPWGQILVCDRFYTLIAARIQTHGQEFVFPVQCRECDYRGEWAIDLESQLPIFDLPEASRAKVSNGDNVFETDAAGPLVKFKLLTGDDERKAGKKLADERDKLMTFAIRSRIVDVDGINKHQIDKWVTDLDMDLQLKLLDAFEVVDGGIDTNLEFECPKCDRVTRLENPFEGPTFWMPRVRSRASSKGGRTSRTMGAREMGTTKDPEGTR